MFIQNFKIAIRGLFQNKIYAIISILGLSVGISGGTLIALYMQDELSFDEHHEQMERIYRVSTVLNFNGEMDVAVTNMALGPTLKQDYPEVQNFVRFYGGRQEVELKSKEHIVQQSGVFFTDSTLFDVFTYPLLSGDPKTALNDPNSIVICKTLAQTLYGDEPALNQELIINNTKLTVKAVMEDIPSNAEIQASAFASLSTMPQGFHDAFNQDWFRISFYTYLLFDEPVNPSEFKQKLDETEEKYVQPWAEANGVVAGHDYSITPLADVHFDNSHEYDLPKGNWSYIYVFSALALFLLLIASINYINLSMAQHNRRSREVGVRKTLGSSKSALIKQFLVESLLITGIAMIIGLALTELFIEPFNTLSGKSVSSTMLFSKEIIITEISILLFVGIIAGAYPALVLSSLNPVHVLKGGLLDGSGVGYFRKSLILVQFVFSIFMISGTLLIGRQMEFMKSMNLGFDREHLLTVDLPADTAVQRMLNPWVGELSQFSGIEGYSRTSPPTGQSGEIMFRIEQDGKMVEKGIKCLFVDDQFIQTMGLELIKGRNFSKSTPTDINTSFIINQRAAEVFGWQDAPLNKRVQWGLLADGQAQNDGKTIGIVNDFHFMSLHNPLEPLILCYNPNGGQDVTIRLSEGDYTQVIESLEERWSEIVPNYTFEYSFFDQDISSNYVQETRMFKVFTYFSAISIIIACLGLFALLSYTIETRKKEIGVRKVLGATTLQLSWVMVKDFALLLILAFAIASPLSFLLYNRWLDNFAYAVSPQVGSFALALFITTLLCLIAVLYHSYKLHRADPVNALREE
ncbi:FtsX-like permease family protein [bacterium]|nr:FtsX-like permease family protein [bacterium]